METAKLQALKDMTSVGVIPAFVTQEKAILEFISEGLSLRVDFRRFNGGHYDKHSLLLVDCYSEDDI
ncbi:MAG: hypothetical protein II344_07730 [Bacteroidales bacterium]|nr:hypothetical protein [Bacteroidales bacterium]